MIIFLIATFTLSVIIGLAGLFWIKTKDEEMDVNKLHHNDYLGEKL
jgi:hypothetical protein